MTIAAASPADLRGRRGMVTGAASGLGRAVLELACRQGASVLALDSDVEAGERAVREVREHGGEAIFQRGDVSDEDDVRAAVDRTIEEFGGYDFVHSCAGVATERRLHETPTELWDEILRINLTGAFFVCKHSVIAMRARGGGSIVNTGSIVSIVGDPELPAYATTKAGLLGLTRAIAVDYAAEGIRANTVCPGDMRTPMLERTLHRADDPAAALSTLSAAYPVGRIAEPGEVAQAVVFLLSDASAFVTGTELVVDGGLTVRCY